MKRSSAFETQNIIILVILVIFFLITIGFYFIASPYDTTGNYSGNYVAKVIDGDTFQLSSGEIIRLICVDSPEQGKAGYKEAKDFLGSLILDKEVRLEKDVLDRDDYNRLLRYVYVNLTSSEIDNINNVMQDRVLEKQAREGEVTEVFVNKELFQQGYVDIFRVEPDVKRCGEIED